MKAKELRLLPVAELKQKKRDLKRAGLQLLVQKKMQTLKNTHELRTIRREIARLNTILAENAHE
jgi:large subunit ribosomal protein L29